MTQIIIVTFLLITLLTSSSVKALEESTSSPKIEVKHIANLIERQKEKIIMFFKFNMNDKVKYYTYLSEKRLAEIAYATKNEYGDRIEETAARYLAHIGNFTEYIESNKVDSHKQELIDMSFDHLTVLENLRDRFPANSGWWLAIQHDINVIKMFSNKLKS